MPWSAVCRDPELLACILSGVPQAAAVPLPANAQYDPSIPIAAKLTPLPWKPPPQYTNCGTPTTAESCVPIVYRVRSLPVRASESTWTSA